MEAQQQPQQQLNEDGGNGKGSFFYRQSNSRWTPTTDQVRVLKDLCYNHDIRSLSDDQVKRISACLRQYGKVEEKNVYYWFQNHKARQKQKERLTTTEAVVPMQNPSVGNGGCKYPTSNAASPTTAPSTGMLVFGQMGSCGGYGSTTMKKCFTDCSLSAGGSTSIDLGAAAHNFGLVGVEIPKLETLPLFPIHGEDINGLCSMKFPTNSDGIHTTWYRTSEESGSWISLELSLSSYSDRFLNEPQ